MRPVPPLREVSGGLGTCLYYDAEELLILVHLLVAHDSVQATSHGGDTAVLRVIEAYCLGSKMKQASSK